MIHFTCDGTVSKEIKRLSENFIEFSIKTSGPMGKPYFNELRCVMYCRDTTKTADHLKVHNTMIFIGALELDENGNIYAFKVDKYNFIKKPEEAKRAYAASVSGIPAAPNTEARKLGGVKEDSRGGQSPSY